MPRSIGQWLLLLVTVLLALAAPSAAAKSKKATPPATTPATTSITDHDQWLLTSVKRTINLATHIEDQTIVWDVQNVGSSALSTIHYVVPKESLPYLSLLEASVGGKVATKNDEKLLTEELNGENSSVASTSLSGTTVDRIYRITLPKSVSKNDKVTLAIRAVYTRTIVPYPSKIVQGTNQLVAYSGNVRQYTPYKVESQSTIYKLTSSRVEDYTKDVAGVSGKQSGSEITYSDIGSTAPYTQRVEDVIKLHYENNTPFVTFLKSIKEVEVSHWGNVAVEENFEVTSTGAALKNGFNRADYERHMFQCPGVVKTIKAELPPRAHSLYYTDRIGNVSTSHVHSRRGAVVAELDPRYPLFGGWKSDMRFGYSLPSRGSLYQSSDDSSRYVLNISFASPLRDAAVDDYEVRVVLPEGAADIEWVTPFHIDSAAHDTKQTYLDTTGRPVVVLRKRNVVNKYHSANFQIAYTYSRSALLWEPTLLVSIFASFFAVALVYSRIRLSIEPPTPLIGYTQSSSAASTQRQYSSSRGGKVGYAINRALQDVSVLLDVSEQMMWDDTSDQLYNDATKLLLDPVGKESDLTELARELYLLLAKLRAQAKRLSVAESKAAEERQDLKHRIALIETVLSQLAEA